MANVQPITPCLWFDQQAEEAANYYTAIFPNSGIGKISRYGKEACENEHHPMPEGLVLTIEFSLNGQKFLGLNGGPMFKFTEAVSFIVSCKDQQELDHYWDKLSEGGDPNSQQCGWLKDKFGVSWQIIPEVLAKLMSDPQRAKGVSDALMKMKKLDIKTLEMA